LFPEFALKPKKNKQEDWEMAIEKAEYNIQEDFYKFFKLYLKK